MDSSYYAVIFTTQQTNTLDGYAEMAEKMHHLAQQQPGFIEIETARSELGITVSYWKSEEAIIAWKNNIEHLHAQKLGKEQWYAWYKLRICRVEREYEFSK